MSSVTPLLSATSVAETLATSQPSSTASPALVRAQTLVSALPLTQPTGERIRRHALAVAEIIANLVAGDTDIVLGACLFPLLRAHAIDGAQVTEHFSANAESAKVGAEALRIATELTRLEGFGSNPHLAPGQSRSAGQAEALRNMLLAILTDPRLILVKLADQLQQLREAKTTPPAEQQRIARETREIFAPLANRLGVWQLKWELEDWAFRYLEPENYKRIAGWLAAKRVDRERYIENTVARLQTELEQAGIHAQVAGRPKHLYSIWRKMQRKGSSIEELYDLRAVRIMVDSITDCYAALGVVHSLWPYIPGEFDDYIATPKDNLYRSLHTAVIGPDKLPLEIQIRTYEMHAHAELGVAAHWRYKEGGKASPAYEQKIAWLRQILEPTDGKGDSDGDFLEQARAEIFEDRVYALSPRGEVIDLPRGATPLDYAYHLHTDLGHRCRGAKINGKMVGLNQPLRTGDQVEIITGKQLNPSRDWLVPTLGYLASPRNRSKVRAWFRKQDEAQNRVQGKEMFERELTRLAVHSVSLPELLEELGCKDAETLYLALGEGEMTVAQITGAIQRRAQPQELPSPVPRKPAAEPKQTGLTIEGIDDLLSNLAACCRPVPPEAIAGYITLGRGVSVHRQDCANLRHLRSEHPERVIAVEWGNDGERAYAIDINVKAFDRRGLLRDISGVLADSKINIHSMNTATDERDGIADVNVRISVQDLEELSRLLARIQGLPNIISARRKT